MNTEMMNLKPYEMMNQAERSVWNHRAAQMMKQCGGGFASALAEAFFRADLANQARMVGAFADLFAGYRETAAAEHWPD